MLEAGRCGRSLAIANNGPFDILITDVRLSDQDRTTLANMLRAVRPELGIVFASGYDKLLPTHRSMPPASRSLMARPNFNGAFFVVSRKRRIGVAAWSGTQRCGIMRPSPYRPDMLLRWTSHRQCRQADRHEPAMPIPGRQSPPSAQCSQTESVQEAVLWRIKR